MEKYTFKMTRVYETLIVVDAKNEQDASNKLKEIDVYQIELEQCCVVHETIELEDEVRLEDKMTALFIGQMI
jgi:hypothetical protein